MEKDVQSLLKVEPFLKTRHNKSMLNSLKFTLFTVYFLAYLLTPSFALASIPKKNHIEELFIWKVSDELNLTAQEEKKFTEIYKKLNAKKNEIQIQINNLNLYIKQTNDFSKKNLSAKVKEYKKLIHDLNTINIQEIDLVSELLGEKRFLEYLAIKQDINLKLKSLVLGDDPTKKTANSPVSASDPKPKALPPPQIIEEK